MAIQSQLKIQKDIYILPVGINYFHHERARYKCIINYGPPISVSDYLDAYKSHKAKALISLRDDLSVRIKQLLIIPEKSHYPDHHAALNRHNERYSFSALRNKLADGDFKIANYKPALKWLPKLLSIANPLAIGTFYYVKKTKLEERQFESSIKYVIGFYFSAIWWVLLFLVITLIVNWKIGLVTTLASVILLFVRSWIKKLTDDIPYPLS